MAKVSPPTTKKSNNILFILFDRTLPGRINSKVNVAVANNVEQIRVSFDINDNFFMLRQDKKMTPAYNKAKTKTLAAEISNEL
ncbi:hypothetical protein LAC02_44210 [Ligilactobacillus acidipiscis]|nr:hypothetical protein LAC02_44210 [Ligilactobacillus acidipiscis]